MTTMYHEGELAVQSRAGVQAMAQRIGRGIHNAIPPIGQAFIEDQIMAVAGSVDEEGKVWASVLMDFPGFLQAVDDQHIKIRATPIAGDPLAQNMEHGSRVGLIVIDLASRQRVRLNGMSQPQSEGFLLNIEQAYSNCPKYIQIRTPRYVERGQPTFQSADELSPDQQTWIGTADTFFIASYHPDGGADASHRGGNAGFVRVIDSNVLEFPDYAGNMMFNTLGNIAANPKTGLLFLDFEQGRTLQLSGEATIIWDEDRLGEHVGAERIIEFRIRDVIETRNAIPFEFDFVQFSPANPLA